MLHISSNNPHCCCRGPTHLTCARLLLIFASTTARFGNRVFDGPLKEVQIIEIATAVGGTLAGSFEVSYQGHSVGLDVGASLAVVEVGPISFSVVLEFGIS